MTETVFLDAGPLSMIAHPRPRHEVLAWLTRLIAAGTIVVVPEIADYEVRRELLRLGQLKGLRRLVRLQMTLVYDPITTGVMLRAAEFWAEARRQGKPTASELSLDADVIFAAQAACYVSSGVIIASSNPKHLARFVPARIWDTIE